MKIDELAYKIYIDEISDKLGFKNVKCLGVSDFFMINKEYYQEYYNKANSIVRKEKLKALNEI